ncbi:MAG: hypothetical protein Q8R91_04440 [Candidatus Omnitrophota bacterium]|nr:hypothetical protein [Candidatus Omnitrophota bacterium]
MTTTRRIRTMIWSALMVGCMTDALPAERRVAARSGGPTVIWNIPFADPELDRAAPVLQEDLNGDGRVETIVPVFGTVDQLWRVTPNGRKRLLRRFPYPFTPLGVSSGQLVAGGAKELVVTAQSVAPFGTGEVQAISWRGRLLWKVTLGPEEQSLTPVVAQMDSDPEPEIVLSTVAPTHTFGQRGIYLLEHDGAFTWPERGIPAGLGCYLSQAAVGDLYGDGRPVIVRATCDPTPFNSLYLVEGNGTKRQISGFSISSAVIVVDIDRIGPEEVVFGGKGYAAAYDAAAQREIVRWTWEEGWVVNALAAGDWDQDGAPEVFVLAKSQGMVQVKVLTHEGGVSTLLLNPADRDQVTTGASELTVGNVDADGPLEVLAGLQMLVPTGQQPESLVYAWNVDGSVVTGFPLRVAEASVQSVPVTAPITANLADLDRDGQTEITLNHVGGLIAWDLPGAPFRAGWPTFRADSQRTARVPMAVPSE